jgi:hypothetical protein
MYAPLYKYVHILPRWTFDHTMAKKKKWNREGRVARGEVRKFRKTASEGKGGNK